MIFENPIDALFEEESSGADTAPVALLMLGSMIEEMQVTLDELAAVILSGKLTAPAMQTATALTRTAQSLTGDYIRLRESYEAIKVDSLSQDAKAFSALEAESFNAVGQVRATRDALQTLIPAGSLSSAIALPCFGHRSNTLQ